MSQSFFHIEIIIVIITFSLNNMRRQKMPFIKLKNDCLLTFFNIQKDTRDTFYTKISIDVCLIYISNILHDFLLSEIKL